MRKRECALLVAQKDWKPKWCSVPPHAPARAAYRRIVHFSAHFELRTFKRTLNFFQRVKRSLNFFQRVKRSLSFFQRLKVKLECNCWASRADVCWDSVIKPALN